MIARTLTRSYETTATPEQVWGYLSDPVALAAASSHGVRVEKDEPGLTVGTTWREHHGAECDLDVVPWRALAVEPGRSITVEGLQAGARQRVTTVIETHATGIQVCCTLELRPSLEAKGSVLERLLIVVMLATGLGLGIVAEQLDETIHDDQQHLGQLAEGERPQPGNSPR